VRAELHSGGAALHLLACSSTHVACILMTRAPAILLRLTHVFARSSFRDTTAGSVAQSRACCPTTHQPTAAPTARERNSALSTSMVVVGPLTRSCRRRARSSRARCRPSSRGRDPLHLQLRERERSPVWKRQTARAKDKAHLRGKCARVLISPSASSLVHVCKR
jgi:hypothetical protein